HLSEVFGLEVRHLGFWNDTVTSTALRKRDLGEPLDVLRPVYGATFAGRDIHFSFHGADTATHDTFENGDSTNNIALRVAFGTPPPPRKIDSRSDITSVPYFENGVGADIGIQIDCYLSETFPFDKGHSDAMYLQLYDDKASNTWMAANIALYGPNGNSGFTEMGGVKGGLETHDHC
ncbi:hypothetical protein V8F33_012330, partial [Rhypophila sp. PSN 637]